MRHLFALCLVALAGCASSRPDPYPRWESPHHDALLSSSPSIPAPSPPPQTSKLDFGKLCDEEQAKVIALKAKVPASKKLVTRKFAIKIDRIFSSITLYNGPEHTILRKDIDRYDDAIVEATGQVPKEIIGYVEETYRVIKTSIAIDEYDDNRYADSKLTATAKQLAIIQLTVE